MGAFEDQVSAELPLRIVALKSSDLGVTGDPNVAVDATLNNSPTARTTFFDEGPRTLWFKAGGTSTDWVIIPTEISGSSLPTAVFVNDSTGDDANDGLSSGAPFATLQRGIFALLPTIGEPRILDVDIDIFDESPDGTIFTEQLLVPDFVAPTQPALGTEFVFRINGSREILHAGVVQTGAEVVPAGFLSLTQVNVVGTPFSASALANVAFLHSQDPAQAISSDQLPIQDNTTSQVTVATRFPTVLGDTNVFDVVRPRSTIKTGDGETAVTMLGDGTVHFLDFAFDGPGDASDFARSVVAFNGAGTALFGRATFSNHSQLIRGIGSQTCWTGVILTGDPVAPGGFSLPGTASEVFGAIYNPASSGQAWIANDMAGFRTRMQGLYVEGAGGDVIRGVNVNALNLRGVDVRNGTVRLQGCRAFNVDSITVEGAGAVACLTVQGSDGTVRRTEGTTGNTGAGVDARFLSKIRIRNTNTMGDGAGNDVQVGSKAAPSTWATVQAGQVTDISAGDAAVFATVGTTI